MNTYTLTRYKSGQISFPKALADFLGLESNDNIIATETESGEIILKKQPPLHDSIDNILSSIPDSSLSKLKSISENSPTEIIDTWTAETEGKTYYQEKYDL